MLLTGAVSSFIFLLILLPLMTLLCAQLNCSGQSVIAAAAVESYDRVGPITSRTNDSIQTNTLKKQDVISAELHAYALPNTIQGDDNSTSHVNRSRLSLLKHIRHRRKNHAEFAQQPTKIPLNTQTISSDPDPSEPLLGLVQGARPLLNRTSSRSNDISQHQHHNHNHHSTGMNFSASTTSPADTMADYTTAAPTIITTTTKFLDSYNLSNSTDPYAFSAETHSFALPTEVQVSAKFRITRLLDHSIYPFLF